MAREGMPLNVIQRQLGHANLRVTTIYLQEIDSAEVANVVHARRTPMASQRRTKRLTSVTRRVQS